MHRKGLVIGILILMLGVNIGSTFAGDVDVKTISSVGFDGNTLYVGGTGPNNYTRIQDAIDNASEGDTVFVYNGTYQEGIDIDKMIYLIGENKYTTIIDSTNISDVTINITADAPETLVEGFTIQNLVYGPNGISVLIVSEDNIINENIIINREGIVSEDSSTGNNISNNYLNTWHIGIKLYSSDNNNIIGNTISGTYASPITLYGSSHNSIINNIVTSDNIYGIRLLDFSEENILSGNIINSRERGISLVDSDNNVISGNTIIGTEDSSLLFTYSHLNKVFRNIINVTDRFSVGIGYSIANEFYENNFLNGPISWQIDFYQFLWFPLRNRWHDNYWGRTYYFPKVIMGRLYFGAIGYLPLRLPWAQFDFSPANEPYDIEVL